MLKFQFGIRTRSGQKVDSVSIIETDRQAAEQKLRQMYRQCDILRCAVMQKDSGDKQWHMSSLEAVLEDSLPASMRLG
jgi:hypothetical protein